MYEQDTRKFKRKTLVDEIKSILQQYPDDGQIFKEIIQNAEDANATEVVFIYDKNDDRNQSLKLTKETLRKHQGPSLYAYNNSKFEDSDWEGVTSLGISKKAKDALKVGRFGLGFKSVFHLTDVPCVASGSTFAYLDPLEDTLNAEVLVLDMERPKNAEISRQYSDFQAFQRLGNQYWTSNNHTNGALFRFPLRQEPSQLSSVCYDDRRFEKLIQKFINEAYLTLIFLKYVKSIKIFVIEDGHTKLTELYSIKKSQNSQHGQISSFVKSINSCVERKEFSKHQNLDHILTLDEDKDRQKSIYTYGISEHFGYFGSNTEFKDMMEDEELAYVPLIAVAYPLSGNDPGGHIFSGLPLPLQSRCMNGMPVHVNGYFALGQDRKDLKWRSISSDESNDKTVNWNIHLIKELLPVVYTNLLKYLVKTNTADVIYQAWPNRSKTDQKWKMFLDVFFQNISQTPCIYSSPKAGWFVPGEVIFLRDGGISQDQLSALEKFLSKANVNTAIVPTYITDSINVRWMDPNLILQTLTKYPAVYSQLNAKEKCAVLSYGINSSQDLSKLKGHNLFPLIDGSYVQLSNNRSVLYYLPTDQHRKEVLPTWDKVIHVDFFASDPKLLEKLKSLFQSKHFNIDVIASTGDMINAVKALLPNQWKQNGINVVNWPNSAVSSTWLQSFIQYRQRNRINFSQLEGIPLIPVEKLGSKYLMKICRQNRPMLSHLLATLSPSIKTFLMQCDTWFVDPCIVPEDVYQLHNENLITAASGITIMEVLERCNELTVLNYFQNGGETLRNDLCDIIKSYNGQRLPNVCYQLPLFAGYKTSTFFSTTKCKIVKTSDIPQEWSSNFESIVTEKSVDSMLLRKFDLQYWSFQDLCTCVVNHINTLSSSQRISFFTFFLQRAQHTQLSSQFVNFMKTHIQILDAEGNSRNPSDLYEKIPSLESFFFGEKGKFPSHNYNTVVLKKFGLKSTLNIRISDVNSSIRRVSELQRENGDQQPFLEKVKSILRLVTQNRLDRNSLVNVPWIPVNTEPPRSYPSQLPWHGCQTTGTENNFMPTSNNVTTSNMLPLDAPNKIYSSIYQNIIGSVACVVHPQISDLYQECFKGMSFVSQKPLVSMVLKHLTNIEQSYCGDEKGAYTLITNEVYGFLKPYASEVVNEVESQGGLNVWHNDGFVSCQKIRLSKTSISDLSPYYYTPSPAVFKNLAPLLQHLGCEKNEMNLYINVLEKIAEKNDGRPEDDFTRDWHLAFSIVNTLANQYETECEGKKNLIFVPIDDEKLRLHPLIDCYYHDYGEKANYSNSLSKNFILHRMIKKDVARKLNVPNLVSKVLSGGSNKLFRPWGQKESLTLKLKRLLEDYRDGLAIVKELIQNADDAGATEVKFLYDRRQNDNLKSKLIDTGMAEWQGPALWVYNDKAFSEEDFENITKINAGTKEFDTTKIGKFGLGFNSVYHLTDVPSFLSGESLVIFDPHGKYLGDALETKGEPGVRIPVRENREELSNFKDQFATYHKIFGAHLNLSSNNEIPYFNGTLFRLPLRSTSTANRSEIKNLVYTNKEMNSLLQKFKESLDTLILFTEHVTSVTVYELKDSSEPEDMNHLFCVRKSVTRLPKQPDASIVALANRELHNLHLQQFYRIPKVQIIEKIAVEVAIQSKVIRKENWINSSCIGSQQSFEYAAINKGRMPCGGVCYKYEANKNGQIKLTPIQSGHVFCFLPLPIQSHLPFHVNGAFGISRDRQSLTTHSEDEKSYGTTNWNDLLAADISEAYYNLLLQCKIMSPEMSTAQFLECFPPSQNVEGWEFGITVQDVLRKCLQNGDAIFPVCVAEKTQWVSWNQLRILEENFPGEILNESISFLNWYLKKNRMDCVCINLPREFRDLLDQYGYQKDREAITVNKYSLFEYLFESIEEPELNAETRNTMINYILSMRPTDKLKQLLINRPCIPTLPNGKLNRPLELVKKGSPVADLYFDDDEVFPSVHESHYPYLQLLGMHTDNLPWHMLLDRARSIEALGNSKGQNQAFTRSENLLKIMSKSTENCTDVIRDELINVNFLKVLQKPNDWIFPNWYGTNTVLSSPSKMFLRSYCFVAGNTDLICEVNLKEQLIYQLNLNRLPSTEHVVQQAKELVVLYQKSPETEGIDGMIDHLYDYISSNISSHETMEVFADLDIVRTDERTLAKPCKVFKTCINSLSGYMHKLDSSIRSHTSWLKFFDEISLKDKATPEDIVNALAEMKKHYKDQPIPDKSLRQILALIPDLCEAQTTDHSKLVLPDRQNILQEVDLLCYKDVHWMPDEEDTMYVTDKISRQHVMDLKIKSLSIDAYLKTAKTFDCWLEFGQNEKLTTRIKNLLEGYSEPVDVFKELLQNADDSGASEIEFILDKRVHKSEKVFSEKWKSLQGPALLVCNNGKFTENDLRGIQSLGDASKKEDPLSTGKYGVGFNSVYSLTDCPVLLTNVESIGDVLCIFDPNLKYAEGATTEMPGSMVKDARQFLARYEDVKSSFLFDEVDSTSKTLFRLPLRNTSMVPDSEISPKATTTRSLEELFATMRKENIMDFLLFTNNIKSLTLKVINENGDVDSHLFTAKSYDVKKKKLEEFRLFQKNYAKKLGSLALLMNSERCSRRKVCIKHFVADKLMQTCHWDVVEQCGFSNMEDIPDIVKELIEQNQLHLIPKGGIAKLSKDKECQNCEDMERHSDNNFIIAKDKNRVFCTLPLPISTGIPAVINGHFILDYETRRNLWSADKETVKRVWNNCMLKDCILPCYINYLNDISTEIGGMYEEDKENTGERMSTHDIKEKQLREFYECFPNISDVTGTYWKFFAQQFYSFAYDKNIPLLAVHKRLEVKFCQPKDEFLKYVVKEANVGIYYEKKPKLLTLLKALHLNIEKPPFHISQGFKEVELALTEATPDEVRKRLVSLLNKILPRNKSEWKISETVLGDVGNVKTVLEYCLSDSVREQDKENLIRISLDNLPLCALANDMLTYYSAGKPVYLTQFSDILPEKGNLFVHREIFKALHRTKFLKDHVDHSCFKEFSLNEFAKLLEDCLPVEKLMNISKPIPLEQVEAISEDWIAMIWKYILSFKIEDKENDVATMELEKINSWSLLLAQRKNQKYLLPVCRRNEVLAYKGSYKRNLEGIFRDKIGVFEPLYKYSTHSWSQDQVKEVQCDIYPANSMFLFGSIGSLNDVINALILASDEAEDRIELTNKDANEVLEYIQTLLSDETLTSEQIAKIRQLPLFEKCDGIITMADKEAIVLCGLNLAGDLVEKIENLCNIICLKGSDSLTKIYQLLNFKDLSWIKFHLEYVIPNVEHLEENEIKNLLEFIMKRIQCEYHEEAIIDEFLNELSKLNLFSSRLGQRKCSSELYDPEVKIFELMQSDGDFPADKFCSEEWLRFMEKLGLIVKPSDETILNYAKALERESNLEKAEEVSKLLCKYLEWRDQSADVFNDLCRVKFLIPYKIDKAFETLHPSQNSSVSKISFKDSVVPNHVRLVWTTQFILPSYAVLSEDRLIALQVKTQKNTGKDESIDPLNIINHINTIVKSEKNFELKTGTCKHMNNKTVNIYKQVFNALYKYMQENSKQVGSTFFKDHFSNTSCLLVNNSQEIDIPSKVLLNDEKVLPPHLNKIDVTYGQYFDVFELLGCSKEARPQHYACILTEIKTNSKGKALEPNDADVAKKSICYLSGALERNSRQLEGELYLPTVKFNDKLIKLVKSQNCIFADDYHMEDRLKQFQEPLLVFEYGKEIDPYEIVNKQLMSHLPEECKPKILSQSIEEVLTCSEDPIAVGSSHVSHQIKSRLKNPQFLQGFKRLLLDENIQDESITNCLNDVQVHVLKNLQTRYEFQKQPIPQSEADKDLFFKIQGDKLHIYFALSASFDRTVYPKISTALLSLLGNPLKESKTMTLVPLLLTEPAENISNILDDAKIRRDASDETFRNFGQQPKPGEPVHIELLALLRRDFSAFEMGEIVAIDTSGDEEHFIYGIVRRLDDNPDKTKRVYGIQTTLDEEHIEDVPFYSVYKFDRMYERYADEGESSDSKELVVADLMDEFADECKDKSYEEITNEIKVTINDLRDKPENVRKVVIRRLYMTWHPDRHPDATKDLATKVFQFLQNELEKLDENFENQHENWDFRASQARSSYRTYSSNFRRDYSGSQGPSFDRYRSYHSDSGRSFSGSSSSRFFYPPPRFSSSNPQPAEAKRWFQQAIFDLEAAVNLQHSTSYEWVCYMAHQSAEKALKAALFSKNFQQMDNVHDLIVLSVTLPQEYQDLAEKLQKLVVNAESTRYPSSWPNPRIPHDQYSKEKAEEAVDLARTILEHLKGQYLG